MYRLWFETLEERRHGDEPHPVSARPVVGNFCVTTAKASAKRRWSRRAGLRAMSVSAASARATAHNGRRLWQCKVAAELGHRGTVMEHTKLPLTTWFLAMYF